MKMIAFLFENNSLPTSEESFILFILVQFAMILFIKYQNFKSHTEKQKTIAARQSETIKNAFTRLHNSPLQTIYSLKRIIQERETSREELLGELDNIGGELREVCQMLELEISGAGENCFSMESGQKLDLQRPIGELFYLIYHHTINQDLPNFKNLKIIIPQIEQIAVPEINVARKKQLCQFLEKALIDVGKQGEGATRLTVEFTCNDSFYILKVEDNRQQNSATFNGYESSTNQAFKALAQKLGAKFQHISPSSGGISSRYQLSWPIEVTLQK